QRAALAAVLPEADHARAGLLRALGGGVGGAVVDDQDLARRRQGRATAPDDRADGPRLVERRQDDGDGRQAVGHRRAVSVAARGARPPPSTSRRSARRPVWSAVAAGAPASAG